MSEFFNLKIKIQRKAKFRDNHRLCLSRVWNRRLGLVCFVGLNPSIADDINDDPTIRRLISFCKEWGYGGFYIVNLFSFISPSPAILKKTIQSNLPENDAWIKVSTTICDITVVCWGNHGGHFSRDRHVLKMIKNPLCFGVTKSLMPKHPLYLGKQTTLIPYKS